MSPLIPIAIDLLLSVIEAAKRTGDEAAEVERQALIKAARAIAIEQARAELKR